MNQIILDIVSTLPRSRALLTLTLGLIFQVQLSQAFEQKKSYSTPPFTAFSSQMPDVLLGSGKYETPVWNMHRTLGLPSWLSVSLEQRTRYETMANTFRADGNGGDQQIALQTALWLEAHNQNWRAGGEFLDARQFGADADSFLNNTHVDEADFIQGYLAWAEPDVLTGGLGLEVVAGRQTLNFGSRRLVARNAYRNTINSFDGLRVRIVDNKRWQLNLFVTKPVGRYPNETEQLLDHFHSFDEPEKQIWFSGGFLEVYNVFENLNAEFFLYHLDEGDRERNPTRNRRYFTPGVRFYIKPGKNHFDFQSETIGQFGSNRETSAESDGKNLDHSAWFQHLDVGYTFDMPWSPRLAVEYDYASGDHDPNDDKDQRFDTLYGARRFDFGPTGIYGPFVRSNINTPGIRIKLLPLSNVETIIGHRFYWLAEDKDAWLAAGLRDKTGNTSNFIGQQLELSARWNVNSSLNLESGWAHLFKGAFARNAPDAPNAEDTDYFYVQSLFRF